MGLVPFAFSIHQIVSSVGADVGFAAILGLAILVLLYFAQARETANLREQTLQAAQRVEQLEARIAQVARRQPVSAPPPVGAPPAVGAVAVSRVVPGAVAVGARRQMAPGPPSGVAAPALASATRMIPPAAPAAPQPIPATMGAQSAAANVSPARSVADGIPASEPADVEVPGVAASTAGVPAVQPAGAAARGAWAPGSGEAPVEIRAGGVAPVEPRSDVTAVADTAYEESGAVAPATFAGAGNGATRDDAGAPPTAGRGGPPPPAGRGGPLPAAHRGAASPLDRPRARPIAPRQPPLEREIVHGRSRVGRLIALLAGAAAAGAVVVVVLMLTQSSSPSPAASSPNHAVSTRTGKKAAAFNTSTVTVAVLNGTAVQGLARRTASRLGALGYKQGTVATASNQTFTATVVAYMSGHRADALQVARALKLRPSAVQGLIDSGTQAVACPQSPCNATVVVTIGADIASH